MLELGVTWEWLPDGGVKGTTKILPAVEKSNNGRMCMITGIIVTYNKDYPRAVLFGDGSEMPGDVIEQIRPIIQQSGCAFKWEHGDFAVIDNVVSYHSRQPFVGRRIVYAGIAYGKSTLTSTFSQTSLSLTYGDSMPQIGFGLWQIPRTDC